MKSLRNSLVVLLLVVCYSGCAGKQMKNPPLPEREISSQLFGVLPPAEAPEIARGIKSYTIAEAVRGSEELLPEDTPFPMKGFAKGTIITLGDDSGAPGTYRLAFKKASTGRIFPLLECRMLEAFEKKLAELGRDARHGKVEVEVKGYLTLYRGINFLLLHDFRLPRGIYPGGGEPATKESLSLPSR